MPEGLGSRAPNRRRARWKRVAVAAAVTTAAGGFGAKVVADELEVCHRLTQGAADFTDTLPPAHEASIDCLAYYGVARGRTDGSFGGDEALSRGAAASLIARAGEEAGMDRPSTPVPDRFRDDDGSVHEANLETVAAFGVLLGRGDATVRPDDPLTRGQAATMLLRTLAVGWDFEAGAVPDAFSDDDASVHEGSLDQMAALGLVAGDGAGRVRPDDPLTRAQAATLLAAFMDHLVGEVL